MATNKSSKRMSQSEIVNHFAEKFELKRAVVKEVFDELAALAGREVKKNGEFVLPGFGKIVLANRKARMGRNPATGETIKIAAKTTLKFRIGKAMKDSGRSSEEMTSCNGSSTACAFLEISEAHAF